MKSSNIRNFCIIAHIDHGKSTLADRLLELTLAVPKVKNKQMLDSMELEQERGITIKLKAVRMFYDLEGLDYQLNLIDTPGHVDFGYEVSRALRACEGALLLVDASQGVQAQTLVNLQKARDENLHIIPVVNKIDLPSAETQKTVLQLIELGFVENQIQKISAKTGEGVEGLLKYLIENIPQPLHGRLAKDGQRDSGQTKALIFDSFYDDYRGVVAMVRIFSGRIKKHDKMRFMATGANSNVIELGYLAPGEVEIDSLGTGEVGFIATGLKDISQVRVGDTVTVVGQEPKPIPGYKEPVPVVFLSYYPQDAKDYLKLREAVEKLNLNDAAFTYRPESIGAIGKGFRCGFLGLLHADIIRERIEREYDLQIIATTPSVRYLVEKTNGELEEIMSAADFPEQSHIKDVKEPWAELSIFTDMKYMSAIMDLCKLRRANFLNMEQMGLGVRIMYEIPLIELIVDFYDHLKSVSSGYASLDYEIGDYKSVDVVKMDILIAGDEIAPLAQLVLRSKSAEEGKRIVKKLKDLIPRQNFKVSLQATIGGKFVAREDISPMRKDVTGSLYGGDVTRKMKLLEKQKKGKKRMQRFGKVDLPQDIFWKIIQR